MKRINKIKALNRAFQGDMKLLIKQNEKQVTLVVELVEGVIMYKSILPNEKVEVSQYLGFLYSENGKCFFQSDHEELKIFNGEVKEGKLELPLFL